jgi:hypothetical protein
MFISGSVWNTNGIKWDSLFLLQQFLFISFSVLFLICLENVECKLFYPILTWLPKTSLRLSDTIQHNRANTTYTNWHLNNAITGGKTRIKDQAVNFAVN